MEQHEHNAALSGEAQTDADVSFPEKETLSFAILLERFYLMNNVYSTADINMPIQTQHAVHGTE